MKSPEERLSLREAADALGISEVSARRWVKSGRLKAYQPGRKYLIPVSAIEELLEETRPPKAQAALQLKLEEQGGADEERRTAEEESALVEKGREAGERVRKRMEAAKEIPGGDEEQREREKYAEALIAKLIEEGEYLEEEIKSSPEGFPLHRAHVFSLGRSFAELLYEEIESTRQPPEALREAKEQLDEQSDRIGALWRQTMHPESGEALEEFQRFAMRRAEISRGEVDEEGAHSASREGESSA